MPRLKCLLCLLVLATACESPSPLRLPVLSGVPTAPAPPPPPMVANPRAISVGEEVKGTFEGHDLDFDLAATRDGMLEATVAWDVARNYSLLVLVLQDIEVKPVPPNWSPVSGKLRVVAGQTYRLRIKAGGTDWLYGDPYVLTTKID